MGRIRLYLETMRHLRASQLFWRMVYRAERMLGLHRFAPSPQDPPVFDGTILDNLRGHLAARAALDPDFQEQAAALRAGQFSFASEMADFRAGIDWRSAGRSRLWRYHLHYCDAVRVLAQCNVAQVSSEDRALVYGWLSDWVRRNPPGTDVAWDAFTVACRLLNWVCAFAVFGPPGDAIARSYAQQARYLSRHLERDISGNHLLKDLMALTLATRLMDWRALHETVWENLNEELCEQILEDGGHYERSPMYHALVLDDLLLLHGALGEESQIGQAFFDGMGHWLEQMTHPDGGIAFFNDAAHGQAPNSAMLVALARAAIGDGVWTDPGPSVGLAESGFFVSETGNIGGRMIIRAGLPGPMHQLGHAHCDVLSFEWSWGKRRVIVNSGTHGYAESPYRAYARSTRAHNTVQVGSAEQLECWATFRVARRMNAVKVWATEHPEFHGPALTARFQSPFGYRHQRDLTLVPPGFWSVYDEVCAHGTVEAQSFLHFMPEFEVTRTGCIWKVSDGEMTFHIAIIGGENTVVEGETVRGATQPQQGWYFPRFGVAEAATVLVLRARGTERVRFGFAILPPSAPASFVESLADGSDSFDIGRNEVGDEARVPDAKR